jgi:hypothetical protein
VLAAVPKQVSLPITINIEPSRHARTLNLCFPNGGVDGLPLPRNGLRQAHVDRKQASDHFLLLRQGLPTVLWPPFVIPFPECALNRLREEKTRRQEA